MSFCFDKSTIANNIFMNKDTYLYQIFLGTLLKIIERQKLFKSYAQDQKKQG